MKIKMTKNTAEDRSGSFKDFPARLKMIRLQKGLTLREYAKTFGVAHNTLWHWENGDREMPYDVIWLILMELDMLK